MMKRKWWVLAGVVLSLNLSGCVLLLLGAGAAGGYAASKDAVTNHYDLPQDTVFRHALAVAKEMGNITLEDPKHGVIKATIQEANVTITVKPITSRTVELQVKARNVMPKVETAQEVYGRIVKRL